ncbi:MAG: efflux RND transporter periplasmic adaptor subunit [Desulfobacteraceae bacterium]|nr:efflux RND transporter periplasmic adaptor subunit [Desulfobacteraceae bacterium]
MRSALKIVPVLVLVVIAAAAVLLVRDRRAELDGMETAKTPALPVVLAEAGQGKIEPAKHYLGVIEPVVSASIAARITGDLLSVRIDTGDRVEKNEVVALIDNRQIKKEISALQAELKGAEAELAETEKRYKRRRRLYEEGHVNREDLDASKSSLASARARTQRLRSEVQAAEISLLYTRIRAPFDGVVTKRLKDAGDLVMPGEPICRIENPDKGYKILVKTDPETARKLSPGARAKLKNTEQTLDAEIHKVYPAADKNRLATVEIRTPAPPFNLPSRACVGVDLIFSTPEAIVLPRRAVAEIDGKWLVFAADNKNRVKPVQVSVLGRDKDQVAVKSDVLKPGDLVVVGDESMLIRLGHNSRIQPLKNAETGAGGR